MKDVGFLISEEDSALAAETRLHHSGLLCSRSFITVKRDRESFWHRHQKGVESVPLTILSKEVIYIFLISLWSEVKSLSCVRLFVTPWSLPGSPSMGFFRQEYWNGLPFPSPGDLPNPGIKPWSPTLEADALTSEPPEKPKGPSLV